MSTPANRPKMRVGLSRQSGSIKKGPKFFTTPCSTSSEPSNLTASTTTPVVSTKTGSRTVAIQKRKLEFAAVNHLKQEGKAEEEVNYETMDLEELRKLVEQKRKSLEIQGRHEKEQIELTALIEKWKQAGNDGLEMLRKVIVPTPTVEALLDSFKMRHDEFD